MREMILSIHPKWAGLIYSGQKKIEIRKTNPAPPFRAWLYETAPVQKITGFVEIDRIGEVRPEHSAVSLAEISQKSQVAVNQIVQYMTRPDGDIGPVFLWWIKDWARAPYSATPEMPKRPPQSYQWIKKDVLPWGIK